MRARAPAARETCTDTERDKEFTGIDAVETNQPIRRLRRVKNNRWQRKIRALPALPQVAPR
jgi:hypothetical protein